MPYIESLKTLQTISTASERQLKSLLPHSGVFGYWKNGTLKLEQLPEDAGVKPIEPFGALWTQVYECLENAAEKRAKTGLPVTSAIAILSDALYIFFAD